MATQPPKREKHTTPEGTFVYPYVVKPDYGNEKFPDNAGSYKVNLRLSEEEAEPLLAALQPLYDQAISDGQASFGKLKIEARKKLKELTEVSLYQIEYDSETEEPTGTVIFKFTTKASGVNAKGEAWQRNLPIFDAAGKSFKPSMVGGGTRGKVSYEASPYFIPGTGTAGVKLYLNAVQIIALSEGGSGGSASSYGFGQEEGYEADEATVNQSASGAGFSSASSSEDDDQF